MTNHENENHKSIHTFINIGLITFLIVIAAIGMMSLSSIQSGDTVDGLSLSSPVKEKVMICAIGQCLLVS